MNNLESGRFCHLLPFHSFITLPALVPAVADAFSPSFFLPTQNRFFGGRNSRGQNQNNRNPYYLERKRERARHMVGYDM